MNNNKVCVNEIIVKSDLTIIFPLAKMSKIPHKGEPYKGIEFNKKKQIKKIEKKNRNIAVRCDNLICIDIDLYKLREHFSQSEIDKLLIYYFGVAEHDLYKLSTYVEPTPRGGYHIVYKRSVIHNNWYGRKITFGGFIDILLGATNYFVASGSITEKGCYKNINNNDFTEMPTSLYDILNKAFTKKNDLQVQNLEEKINKQSLNKLLNTCDYNSNYSKWLLIGWCFKSLGGKFKYFNKWSSQSAKYKDETDCYNKVWGTFSKTECSQNAMTIFFDIAKKDNLKKNYINFLIKNAFLINVFYILLK